MNYDSLFIPEKDTKADSKRDYITGEPLTEGAKLLEEEDNTLVNKYTYEQIDLGKKLRDADFWIQRKKKIEYWQDKGFEPVEIGYYNYFLTKEEIEKKEKELKASIDNARIRRINNTGFLETILKGAENTYGFCFYGGNDYPQSYGQPKLFEELAGVRFKDRTKEEKLSSPSLVRFGILRMDV